MQEWKKNLYVIWICQFIAMLGMSMVVPFLPLFVKQLGVTDSSDVARWSGLVFSGPFWSSLFLTPVWGYLGDRYSRKLMVVRAIFGLGIAQLINGSSASVYQLFTGRLIQGIMSGFIPASMALVSATTPKEKTGYALGLLQMATSGGIVIGPFVGGFLSDIIGIRAIFYITFALCVLSGLLVLIYVKEEKEYTYEKKITLLDNYKFVWKSLQLRLIIFMVILSQIAIGFNQPFFALYVESLKIESRYFATIAGFLYGIMGIFTMIGSPLWGRYNEKNIIKNSLAVASLVASICYVLHSIIYDPVLIGIVRSFLGLALGGLMPVLFTLVSNNTPLDRRGGLMGIASSAQIFGNLSGPIVSGLFASEYGIRSVFIVSSIILMFVSILSYKKIQAN